jgi:hypothetical protein
VLDFVAIVCRCRRLFLLSVARALSCRGVRGSGEFFVAVALEAVGRNTDEKAPDEFVGGQRHDFLLAAGAIVLQAEAHLSVFDAEQMIVGDGNAVRRASDIVQDLERPCERRAWSGSVSCRAKRPAPGSF